MEFLSLNSWMKMELSEIEGERRSRFGGQDMQLIWGTVKIHEKKQKYASSISEQALEEPEKRVRSLREKGEE